MNVQQIMKEQDEQVEDIADIVKRIKANSRLINNELDNQKM